MKYLQLTLLIIIVFLSVKCTEEKTIIEHSNQKNLVILSDNDKSSDMIISLMGSVKTKYPDVNINYIQINEFDIFEASYLLDVAVNNYPDGTYFAALVEPDSATKRIVFQTGNKRILAPNNGLVSRVLKYNTINTVFNTDIEFYKNLEFYDFYKQAILNLLSEKPISDFGSICENPVKYDIQEAEVVGDTVKGEILFVDNFGNCITNINSSIFEQFNVNDILHISTNKNSFFIKYGTSYTSVAENQNICFLNDTKRLEIAVDFGSMANRYNIKAGDKISVSKKKAVVGILCYNDYSIVLNIINN